MRELWVPILEVVVLVGAAVFVLGYWVFRRVKQRGQTATPMPGSSEMTILFQTLRSLIHEQKVLAREFNRSVDKKVTLVREVTRAFAEERERLSISQRELRELIERLHVAVDKSVPGLVEGFEIGDPHLDTADGSGTGGSDDLIDNWVGLDFVGEEESADRSPAPEPEPPAEPREQAREAVNALLGMNEPAKPAGSIHPFPEVSDEGGDRLSAVRVRAYKYHDAGMSVADIARELGIGKGEVRLMLNLREKAE